MSKEAIKLALEWIEKQPEEITATRFEVNSRYVVIKELEAALAQQRTWVGLTDEQIKKIAKKHRWLESNVVSHLIPVFKSLEAKLEEKNT